MKQLISAYWTISSNFGDLIGPYILEKMTGAQVIYSEPTVDYPYYVFGGSILNHINDRGLVWGAGLGSLTDGVNPDARLYAVRGPLTRARALSLGIDCPDVYGDPGSLLPRFIQPSAEKCYQVGVVPHYVDSYRGFHRYTEPDFHCIDVMQSIESVVKEITSCHRIISSSLHGIIVAHAYGIPAVWVKMSDSLGGDGTKFRDYFASVGMDVPKAIDMREKAFMPVFEHDAPKIDTELYWKRCPVNQEWRKKEYRTQ